MVARPKHLPPAQHGTELEDSYGCHPRSAYPTVVGGLAFILLGGIFLASVIVALWRALIAWIGGAA